MNLTRYNACEASQRKYTEYLSTDRVDADGRVKCPACQKVVKLRKNYRGSLVVIPSHTPRDLEKGFE